MLELTDYSDVSPREFALGVCADLRVQFGVDLASIFTSPSLSVPAKRKAAHQALVEAIISRAHQQGYQDFLEDLTDPAEHSATARLLRLGEPADTVDTEPNYALTARNAEILRGYEGDELKNYVFNLTKRFENMANATSVGVLAAEMSAGAVIAVGVPVGVAVFKALRAGSPLLAAMRIGITSIGIKTAITAVAAVLVALLLYLVLENPKKILGLVLNNTDENFVVNRWQDSGGDLHMEHGEMADFMEDYASGDLDSPRIQLKSRDRMSEDGEDDAVWAGVYFADRNFGFRGAEGVVVFSSTKSDLSFAHMFAVPYTNDNGTNMRLLKGRPGDLSKLYRDMYDSRRVRVAFVDEGYRFTSTVNDARGGVVACLASISSPS